MFSLAYLQDLGNGKLRIEEKMLKAEFERRGTPVELYTIKRIQRRNLPLSSTTFIAGDMDAMHGAMSQLEIDVPVPDDYRLACPRSCIGESGSPHWPTWSKASAAKRDCRCS